MIVLALLWHWRRVLSGWQRSLHVHRWKRFIADVERQPGDVTRVNLRYTLDTAAKSGGVLTLKDWAVR